MISRSVRPATKTADSGAIGLADRGAADADTIRGAGGGGGPRDVKRCLNSQLRCWHARAVRLISAGTRTRCRCMTTPQLGREQTRYVVERHAPTTLYRTVRRDCPGIA